jgi:hypothetical protein
MRREVVQRSESGGAKRKCTLESVLQPLETRVEFAISCTPNAEFGFMLLIVELSKSFQLTDLGIAALDLDTL